MEMPVKSKVEEISLRPHEFLLPLFEVVVNSIISLINRRSKDVGLIRIIVERTEKSGLFDSNLLLDKDGNLIPPSIESLEVIDNGIGFTDTNFKSFNTVYSDFNKAHGCKGVGRFTMLACFEEVEIRSVFKKDNQQWVRNFKFNVDEEVNPKDGAPVLQNESVKNETSVRLTKYKSTYKSKSAIGTKEIAEGIIDHCLPFFLNNYAPTVVLEDRFFNLEIVLNDLLQEVIKFDGDIIEFKPQNASTVFSLQVIKKTDGRMNRLRLCANNRVVGKTRNLAVLMPEFEAPLKDAEGNSYYIDVYVTSEFLNKSVNSLRNSFNILEEPDEAVLISDITMKDIDNGIIDVLSLKYKEVIEKLQIETLKRVRSYILDPKKMRVRYRSLLSRPDLLRKIPYNSSPDKIEEHLIRIKIQLEKELSQNLKQALRKSKPEDYEEYSSIIRKYIDQEAKFAKDKLADLVIHRRGVLDLIKRLLKLSKDGKYALEEDLHNIIFPMGEDSDTLPYEYHNLWLLDERLAFHAYVASDKKLKSNPHVKLNSKKEADLLIFDFPWAFSEREKELTSMVVFELKRPGRDLNTDVDKKLDNLVMKYFEDLMADKARDEQGELLNLEDTTPKFGFIICDLDKGIIDYNIKFNEFRKTPNNTLYKIITPLNLHIEAMSYQQMISMSEKRHLAFFRELGIDE